MPTLRSFAPLSLALALFVVTGRIALGQEAERERYLIASAASHTRPLDDLIGLRRSQGLEVRTLALGSVSAAERRDQIVAEVKRWQPRYLLLVGDVDQVPTFVVRECATDRPYGDLDGDGFPEVAIGRFPTNSPEVVRRIVARTVAYERRQQPGLWRRQVALIAGEARFSPVIDRAIEGVFTRVIKETLPLGYDVDLTYANPNSPYCYPPERFAARVIERLNEGALVMAYIGHGSKRSVDSLTVPAQGDQPEKHYRVLDVRDIPRLSPDAPSPIVFAIACWNGNLDGDQQCIGEELLAAPGGPVAFFGASRISHPVHNGLLAKELIHELFLARTPRLGVALDNARRALVQGRGGTNDEIRTQVLALARAFVGPEVVDGEMPRHVDMYNLFGDPALVVATPRGSVELKGLLSAARPSPDLFVEGRVTGLAGPCALRLTLETPRDMDARPARPGETRLERYARANDKVLATEFVVSDAEGRFRVTFATPADAPAGTLVLKAFAQDKSGGVAVGGVELRR